MQSVMPVGQRPTGQHGERLATQPAESAPHPHAIVPLVVRRLAPLPVADDRRLPTQRTPTWHLLQADPSYPGTVLSSAGGHEIKRITVGVKACRWVLLARIRPVTGLHPPGVLNIKRKRILSFVLRRHRLLGLAGIKRLRARITALYLVSHPVMVPVACPVAQRSFSEDWQSTMSTEQGLTPRGLTAPYSPCNG